MTTLLIILLVFLFSIAIITAFIGDGERIEAGAISVITCIIVLVSYLLIDEVKVNSYKEGFKDGQIQAIIGNQHFRREIQPDSTVIWVQFNPTQNQN